MKDKNVEAIYRLSPMQEGMLFHLLYDPEAGAYLRQLSWPIRASLNPVALREAWQRVVDRHSILRSAFLGEGRTEPVQVVLRSVAIPWEEHDWRELAAAERAERLEALLRLDRVRPFPLKKAPVMRMALIRLDDAVWQFVWSYPQLLLDGWSKAAVLREVVVLYRALAEGREAPLERPRPFRDYIAWLRRQDLSRAETFWREHLGGFSAPTALPFDREAGTDPGVDDLDLHLPAAATARLQHLARTHQLTLSTVVQGAWSLLLGRLSGEAEVLFGVTVSGRPADLPGIESMIGLFINTLPLRVDLPPGEPLAAWLRQLQDRQSEIRQFEYSPLVEIQSWSEIPRRQALFDSILVFENYATEGVAQEDQLGIGSAHSVEWVGFPLILVVAPGEQLLLRAGFETGRFDRTTVVRLLGHLSNLLENFSAGFDRRLRDVRFLGLAERHQLLREWNDTEVRRGPEDLAPRLFARHAARAPESLALLWDGGSLTYRELSLRAGALAGRLRELGVGPEVVVAVVADRSADWIAALLAVSAAGGVYLPLDPSYPADRLRFLLEDSGARVVLGKARPAGDWIPPGAAAVAWSGETCCEEDATAWQPEEDGGERHLAYLIYTSGSTGRPKGVMVDRLGLFSLATVPVPHFDLGPGSRMLQLASPGFDASLGEIWTALSSGATLCLADRDALLPGPGLARVLRELRVTHLMVTPSALAALPEQDFPELRSIGLVGEALPPDLVRRWSQPGRRLFNGYGPTEAAVCATIEHLGEVEGRPPIGRPFPNFRAVVLDPELQPVAIGMPGELHLGGSSLARGYVGRPDLTADRFVPDPLSDLPGERLYRTGDRAALLADGRLESLGRIDSQVKVRGVRIEPEEIEAVLCRHPGVRDAVVVAVGDGEARRLVACVTPEDAPPGSSLLPFLSARLPEAMVPAAFLRLPQLPRTSRGKLDRAALIRAAAALDIAVDGAEAPRTPVEEVLAGIWQDVLRTESPIGIHDDFFARGGHSLLATRVVARVEEALGVALPIRALFEERTLESLAARIEGAMALPSRRRPPIVPVPRDRDLPLAFAQQRLWFLHQMEPESPAYNIPIAFRLTGDLNRAVLASSVGEVMRRHEVLRTTFETRAGKAVQVIAPPAPVSLPLVDAVGVPTEVREAEARRLVGRESALPFDLAQDPVLRTYLVRLGPSEHVVSGTLHHIAGDGWSIGILVSDLAALYGAIVEGRPSPLKELAVQYADFAVWQREWLSGEVMADLLAYWRGRLGTAPAILEVPTDRQRPTIQTFRGAYRRLALSASLSQAVSETSRRESATPFMTLLSAFAALLGRTAGQEDIVLGTPIAGRSQVETEGLVGFFVNTLALRLSLADDPDFRQLIARAREVALGAYTHQDLPFERLVEELRLGRDLGRQPLFQVMLVLQNLPAQSFELPSLHLHPFPIEGETAKLDLTLSLATGAGEITGSLSYNTDLFDATTVERLMAHFGALLEGAVRNPGVRLSTLPLISDAERHQLMVEWGESPGTADLRPVHELFAIQARRTPEAPALVFAGGELSYRELDSRADRLAARLARRGMVCGARVAVAVDRSVETIVAFLGILKAGSTYVPLDPSSPRTRRESMLSDSGAVLLLLGGSEPADAWAGCRIPIELLRDDGETRSEVPADLGVCLGDSAYLIYTSGSTGTPKGIVVSHRALAARISSLVEAYGLGGGRRMLQFLSLSFDAVAEEIYPVLVSGGALVLLGDPAAIPPGELLDRAGELGVDSFHVPPSYWYQILEHLETTGRAVPEHVGLFVTGGESSSVDKLAAWRRATRHPSRFFNAYGPSETTITATVYEVPQDPHAVARLGRVPLGRPLPGSWARVLTPEGQPLPIGVPGELCLGGCLADGYLGRPDLTAERFVPDSSAGRSGERLYRTGDLVRWRAEGNLDFLGRIDGQVQVRGLRVELGEVEEALLRCPGVRRAAVVASHDGSSARLAAYLVADGETLALSELRHHLKERLPEHMVPASVVLLESLPLSPSGKVDRRALLASEGERLEPGTSFVPPTSPAEKVLAAIWRDVLGLEQVGIYDNFFELGGDSVRTIQIVSRARQAGIPLAPRSLFEHQTIAGLAAIVGEGSLSSSAAPTEPAPRPEPYDGEERAPAEFPLAGIDEKKLDRLKRKYDRISGH